MDAQTTSEPSVFLRLLRTPVLRLAALLALIFYLYLSGHLFRAAFAHGAFMNLVVVAWMIAFTLAAYIVFAQAVELRAPNEVSLPGMARELGAGMLLGAGLYTACVVVLMALGYYRIDGFNDPAILFGVLWFAASSGFFEELIFRGVLFRITQEVFGSWVGVIVSSLTFGLVHLNNEGATLKGVMFIAIETGPALAACYMLTGRLWLGIGLHAAWNFTQSGVFSGINSGNEPSKGWIRSVIEGPDLLTGGGFGMEASIIAFVLWNTLGVIMLIMAARRGKIAPPFWARAT
ncbi:MAG: lysostaphin resistance A-like protein [Beijerinckiaceae bacterium]